MEGVRNGGEKPRTLAGAISLNCSLNCGYCTASRVSGSHSWAPLYVHSISCPSHTTLKLIGRKTYHPNAEALVMASQYRRARAGMTPPTARSALCGGRGVGTICKN